MALLQVQQSIENSVWKLTFTNDSNSLSETDRRLMAEFGEPTIDIGGTFLTGGNAFTLPDQHIRIKSEFPFTQEFDSTVAPFNTNTQTKVLGYRDAIVAAFTAALTALRANSDTFTGQQEYNI